MQLVLSLFPGIDLLGRGFELEGFCVVRGPDLIFGGDIRNFDAPRKKFEGVIAGSPCQDFSRARRSAPSGDGDRAIAEFRRVVTRAAPDWFLLENVPACPDVRIDGYTWQRIDLDARDCGLPQRRLRHFQFGRKGDRPALVIARAVTRRNAPGEATCMATERRRDWGDFCDLQGLPRTFELPGMTKAGRYRAVGNGVPIPMARLLAKAIAQGASGDICACGCARPVTGRRLLATVACRKREQRRRDRARFVTGLAVTSAVASR